MQTNDTTDNRREAFFTSPSIQRYSRVSNLFKGIYDACKKVKNGVAGLFTYLRLRLVHTACFHQLHSLMSYGVSRSRLHWKLLASGQLLSFCLASAGGASGMLHTHCNLSAPTFQMALTYMMMSFHMLRVCCDSTSVETGADDNKRKEGKKAGPKGASSAFCLPWRRKLKEDFVSELELNQSFDDEIDSIQLDSQNQSTLGEKESHGECVDLPSTPIPVCGRISLHIPLSYYFTITVMHVEANYFLYLAYRFTTITSVSLLDNLSIVSAMVGSRLLLKRMYRSGHIVGALICVVGVILNLSVDLHKSRVSPEMIDDDAYHDEEEEYPHRITGDFIAVVGGLLTGICDVVIELVVKEHGAIDEFLGTVGLLGVVISFFQAMILERTAIAKFLSTSWEDIDVADEYEDSDKDDANPYDAPRTCPRPTALGLLTMYCIACYVFNAGVTYFLTVSESAFLTLSILTCDLWAVVFTVIAEHVPPSPLFYVAFILICVGVFVYESVPSPLNESPSIESDEDISDGVVS